MVSTPFQSNYISRNCPFGLQVHISNQLYDPSISLPLPSHYCIVFPYKFALFLIFSILVNNITICSGAQARTAESFLSFILLFFFTPPSSYLPYSYNLTFTFLNY